MRKLTKSSKEWECKKGCDLSKGICRHLESLLPGLQRGKYHPDTPLHEIFVKEDHYDAVEFDKKCKVLEADLIHIGFDPVESTIIVDRLVGGLTIQQLSKRFGCSRNYIIEILNKVNSKKNEIKEYLNES